MFGSLFRKKEPETVDEFYAKFRKRLQDDLSQSRKNTYAYTWSCIEEDCPRCQKMDGIIVHYEDFLKIPNPLHKDCTCIWVAILKDETNPPSITGLPRGKILAETLEELHAERLD